MILEFPSVRMNRREILARRPERQTNRGRDESQALRHRAALFVDDPRAHFISSAATPAHLADCVFEQSPRFPDPRLAGEHHDCAFIDRRVAGLLRLHPGASPGENVLLDRSAQIRRKMNASRSERQAVIIAAGAL
jgi:hypothetical protein